MTTELDATLAMRFDESGRELLWFNLDEEWDGEFPPSLMIQWRGLTFLMVTSAVDEPRVLEVEVQGFVDGDSTGIHTVTINPLH